MSACTTATASHIRHHRSVLAEPEKRFLVWLAKRLPDWIHSDHLTLLGLFAMLLAGLSFWAARWNRLGLPVVVIALGLNWLGDSLDGTVARVRNRQRPRYGYYVDHVIDILGAVFMLGGLALSGYMNAMVALGVLVAYLMVSAEVYLATHARGVFKMSAFGCGPTELRILLAVGTLYLLHRPYVGLFDNSYRLFDVGGLVAIFGLGVTMLVSIFTNTRALYRAETSAS